MPTTDIVSSLSTIPDREEGSDAFILANLMSYFSESSRILLRGSWCEDLTPSRMILEKRVAI